MVEIKRLDKTNQNDYQKLNTTVREALVNKDWFMPISENNLEKMFDADSTLCVYGAFVDGVLAATSLFDCCHEEFAQLSDAVGMSKSKKGAELGVCMVLPEYRGRNLMLSINLQLIEEAKKMGIDYLVATAHPYNIASGASLKKLGMKYVTTLKRNGTHVRNVYWMEL